MGCSFSSEPPLTPFVMSKQTAELNRVSDTLDARRRRHSLRNLNDGVASELTFKSRADFTMRDIIGKGGKSVGVVVAFHHATQRYFAIKFISRTRAEEEAWEVQPLDEMLVMREVTAARCPFITPLRGWFEEGGTIGLVMSYMPGGELFSRLNGRRMSADEAKL